MPTITTGGSGNWSSVTPNAPWPSGVVPTAADDVILNHTVTLSSTGNVANSLTISSTGNLAASASANSDLKLQGGIVNQNTAWTMDMSGAAAFTCNIFINNANNVVGAGASTLISTTNPAGYSLKGAAKTRTTTTTTSNIVGDDGTSGKLITAVDATGWRVGDKIAFATTQAYNATPKTDLLTLGGAYVNGSTTLVFTSGLMNAHAAGCFIGNLTANLNFGPATTGQAFAWNYNHLFASAANAKLVQDVAFNSFNEDYPNYGFGIIGNGIGVGTDNITINNCVFYDFRRQAIQLLVPAFKMNDRTGNVFYSDNQAAGTPCILAWGGTSIMSHDTNMTIFRAIGGVDVVSGDYTLTNSVICGIKGGGNPALNLLAATALSVVNSDIFSNNTALYASVADGSISTSRFGTQYGGAAANNTVIDYLNLGQITATDCQFQSGGALNSANLASALPSTFLSIVNKNAVVTAQEIYRPYGTVKRDNANNKRSTSAISIKPSTTGVNTQYTVGIPCANGATIRVVGYCKADTSFYNGGGSNYNAPTVTLSGLGAMPVVYTSTSAANNAFEKFDISITNSSGADGNFTLTFNANAKVVTTGTVYFDGVPTNSPFVTKSRHYGFAFDQTLPQAVVNSAVVASEATAGAYTDFTVTGGVSLSPVVLTANSTFQKLYDYTQAWSCITGNLGYAVPISAPVAGVLLAASNLTTTGFALTGSGSITMGANTLTSEFTVGGYGYTFTSGTYAQASAGAPVFTGGTLSMPAQGAVTNTYTFSDNGGTINFAPSANGANYNLGAGTFTGTITLTNTAGHTCTVQLPAGTTVNNTTSGANLITVVTPSLYQSVTVTGYTTGSRIQIYDATSATELYNNVPGASSFVWTDPAPAAASRAIRLRVAYCAAASANQFVDTNIGTSGTASGNKDISYIVNSVADSVYVNNLVDGTAITDCAISGTALLVQVNAGSTTWQRIYAFMTYWLSTAGGIRDQFLEMVATDQTHYTFNSGHGGQFKIKNVTSGPTVPLLITGGNAAPDAGTITNILDTTGGSIFCVEGAVVAFNSSSQAANVAAVQAGLTAQGFTTSRAPKIDQLDAAVSSRLAAGSYTAPDNVSLTLVQKLLRNKFITDPGTGVMMLYDDDGVTPLLSALIYENAAGTQAYRGQGAERRERLA